MTQTLQIGPLTLPLSLLLILGAVLAANTVARWQGRKVGVDVEPHLFRILLIAVVCARVAFVWQYRASYSDDPLSIIDIRDGGWSPQAGVVAAWIAALVFVPRRGAHRKPLMLGMGVASVIWISGSVAMAMSSPKGVALPDIRLLSMDGQTVSLAGFDGKPTVVNLWASWCPPCVREMPVLQRAQAEQSGVNFVFLNQGESPDKVANFLAAHRLELRNVLLDAKGQAALHFGQRALPTTLFFDARGLLVDTRVGEVSVATLAQRLSPLLPQSPSSLSEKQ